MQPEKKGDFSDGCVNMRVSTQLCKGDSGVIREGKITDEERATVKYWLMQIPATSCSFPQQGMIHTPAEGVPLNGIG